MASAGQRLRELRESHGMTVREVEEVSYRLVSLTGNDEYALPISRISDFETKGILPSIYRLYSLSVIYRADLADLLSWYGIEVGRWAEFANLSGAARTSRMWPSKMEQHIKLPVGMDPSFDLGKTTNIGRMIDRWGVVPLSYLENCWKDEFTYAYIGAKDFTMYPLLMPGSFVQVDETKDKVLDGQWHSEYERPIYLVESREGFTVCWCSVRGSQITLQSHPLSPVPVRIVKYPQEAEVVGQVVGLAMKLDWREAAGEPPLTPRLDN
jgi:transcriptional regulator with XRE-family HTH domain